MREDLTPEKLGKAGIAREISFGTQDDVMLDIELSAMLGKNSATAKGWWRNPGPKADMRFEVVAEDFPLDGRFRNALEEKHQKVVESLALEGQANAKLVLPPPGTRQNHTTLF